MPAASRTIGDAVIQDARIAADAAAARAGVVIEAVHDAPGCRRATDVLNAVWGVTDVDMMDPALLVALSHSGNPVLIVRVDGVDVGAAVGFNGTHDMPFHSHIVGLVPSAIGRGIGKALKLSQRAWCLANGIDSMTWTYDPLVARNAAFNIRRLGASVVEYLPEFYGVMRDSINAGQASDRMLARWDLLSRPGAGVEPGTQDAHIAVGRAGQHPTPYVRPSATAAATLVATPADIERLRLEAPDAAAQWRLAVRAALTDLLSSGWTVSDFTSDGHYLLHPERKP